MSSYPLIERLGLHIYQGDGFLGQYKVPHVRAGDLERVLSEAKVVAGSPERDHMGRWYEPRQIENPPHTHSAILLGIQEIKPKECSHEWLVPHKNRTTCKLCGRDGFIRMDAE